MSAWKAPGGRDDELPNGETAWLAAVRAELARAPRGTHLSEETWLALGRGETPHDGIDALTHVARCPECRDVLRAVRALQAEAPAAVRVRARSPYAMWRPLLAAAAVLLVLGAGWLARRPPPPPDATVVTADVATPNTPPRESGPARPVAPGASPATPTPHGATRPDWLRATPPAIALYSPGALTARGTERATFPDALAEALEPWRAGRYAEAARRLEALGSTYPDAVEVPFYRGVALLLAGAPRDALAPLHQALVAAPPALRGQAAWYLGLALLDTDRPDDARRRFADACRAGHARGCDAARLRAPREGV